MIRGRQLSLLDPVSTQFVNRLTNQQPAKPRRPKPSDSRSIFSSVAPSLEEFNRLLAQDAAEADQ